MWCFGRGSIAEGIREHCAGVCSLRVGPYVGLPGMIFPLSCTFKSNYGEDASLVQLHSAEDMV